jgi:hypothetical protein
LKNFIILSFWMFGSSGFILILNDCQSKKNT